MILDASTVGLRVEVVARSTTSLALARARVPLIESMTLHNPSETPLHGLRLVVRWEAVERVVPVPDLAPGERVVLAGVGVPANETWLAQQDVPAFTEAPNWQVLVGAEVAAAGVVPVEVRPFDEWPGERAPLPLLACFVPSGQVGNLAAPGDPLDMVWERLSAIDFAVEAQDGGPRRGTRIRSLEALLSARSANAVELAVLFAACAERVGAGVVLAVTADRVLVGVDPEVPASNEVVIESFARFTTRKALRVFDPTVLARGNLAAAERRAKAALDAESFVYAVDLAAARADGWPPLFEIGEVRTPRRYPTEVVSEWRSTLAGAGDALSVSVSGRVLLPLVAPSLAELAARVGSGDGWIELVSVGANEDRLQVPLADDERVARASALESAAAEEVAEHGAGGCFLVLGFLRWSRAEAGALAPVVLVPAEIDVHRSARKVRFRRVPERSIGGFASTAAPELHRPLSDLLRREFGFELSVPPLDVEAVLGEIRAAVSGRGWEVQASAALVHLPPSALPMIEDLDRFGRAWLERPLFAALADGESAQEGIAAVEAEVPAREFPVPFDADAGQVAAIRATLPPASSGRSFVLLGAPGTGKSQTVANLAAAAMAAGRRVLVVASRVAALEGARRRLEGVGLGEWVLPLYRHEAADEAIQQRWLPAAPPSVGRPGGGARFEERAAELDVARREINGYVRALHQRRASGWSFYDANARWLAVRELPVVPLGLKDPLALTAEDLEMFEAYARRFAVVGAVVEPVAEHPYADTHPTGSGSEVVELVDQRLKRAAEMLEQVYEKGAELAAALDVPVGTDLVSIERMADAATLLGEGPFPAHAIGLHPAEPHVLDAGARSFRDEARAFRTEFNRWQENARTVLLRWHPGVYRADQLERLVERFATWSKRPAWLAWMFLYGPRRSLRRHARKGLPDNATIATDLEKALAVETRRDPLFRERKRLAAATGGQWDTEDPEDVVEIADRAEDVLAQFRAFQTGGLPLADSLLSLFHPNTPLERRRQMKKRGVEGTRALERFRAAWKLLCEVLRPVPVAPDAPLEEYQTRLDRYRAGHDRFEQWADYHLSCSELAVCGLGAIVELHRSETGRVVHAAEVPGLVDRSVLKEWVAAARQADDPLRTFSGTDRHRALVRFRKLDEAWLEVCAGHVAQKLEERRAAVEADGALLAAGDQTIRERFARAPAWASVLFPCVLASPSAVAAHLPESASFDLVLFDEAACLPTAAAIGAVARASQMVVVGDDQQLQPAGMRSILDDALRGGFPAFRLTWHHRAEHEDLVWFTRERLYQRSFVVLPGSRSGDADHGVTVLRVAGRYDRTGTRTNPTEARVVADTLVTRLLQTNPGDRTFAVVALDRPQAAAIAALVDEARRERPEIEGHFLGVPEPVLVGDPWTVVGQERDEVLISVGFAADERGVVPASFGPLSQAGGERWLHAALTRARRVTRVFTGLDAASIDQRHTWSRGVLDLRDFLQWAFARPASWVPPVSPGAFEREVAAALHARGWEVAYGVGAGGYRVDVAVIHPDRPEEYLLGIELDGSTYASAPTARDRDRLRPRELETRGWRLFRIWSTDWALDVSRELRRLEQALDDVLIGDSASDETTEPISTVVDTDEDGPAPVPVNPEVVTYVEAEPGTVTDQGSLLHDEDLLPDLKRVVQHVLDKEAPIHLLELTRRVGAAFGVTKITVRAQKRVLAVACALEAPATVRGEFVWAAGQDPSTYDRVRGPTAQGGAARAIEHIPPEEIAHAVRQVLASDGAEVALRSVAHADLVRETARVFGIQRVGRRVSDGISRGLQVLEERSEVVVQGERVIVLR